MIPLESLYGRLGFVNNPYAVMPNNIYMPENLFQRVLYAHNMALPGSVKRRKIVGGGIAFEEHSAEQATLGEYVERYVSNFQQAQRLFYGSFTDLQKQYACYPPSNIRYFQKKQYEAATFSLKKLEDNTPVHWIESEDYISGKRILLPFFMSSMENVQKDGMFHINTSTGTAAHCTIQQAVTSGLSECVERDAFARFWYYQKIRKYRKYNIDFILKRFPKDPVIMRLFANKKVKIITYDIGELSYLPTFTVFILFKKSNKIYHSVGSASRLTSRDALIRACVEAYQGVEYVGISCEGAQGILNEGAIRQNDFSGVNSFEKHFAFYNLYPDFRVKVPILKEVLSDIGFSTDLEEKYVHHIRDFSGEELLKKGIGKVYFTVLSSPDIRQLGWEVVKVTTPELHLLTGDFNYPYLGNFTEDRESLFTELPHPFP